MSDAARWSDLGPRFGVGALIAAVGLACVWLGGVPFLILTVVISAVIVWELVRMLDPDGPAVMLAVVAGLALFIADLLPAGYALPLVLAPIFVGVGQLNRHRATFSIFTLMILLAGFGMYALRENYGPVWMMWLALVVIATDVMGYFAGRFIGGPKMWPRVSPKKTWSGTVAGWLGAAVVALIFVIFTGANGQLVGVAVALSMASQIGDIAESAVKRRAQVKDSSSLLPGHGGLFDRFDGMLGASVLMLMSARLIDFPRADSRFLMRRITVLGATGSIGGNTLDLIGRRPQDFHVVALTGGRNVARLAELARAHRAEIAVTAHEDCLLDLRDALTGTGIETAAGVEAIIDAAARPADWIMSAIVGAAGLPPGLRALEQGTTLALANKESLVCAGPLLIETARRHGAKILPVDSEHSAVFQALIGEDMTAVERIIITASGGAFRDWTPQQMAAATPEQAASHPNWDMGQRITIDSASLFNKALELIETREFFGIDPDRIEALVHPESMIHAMVGFHDGALMAHIGPPDMRHAIGFALNHPERHDLPVERLDFAKLGQFTFRAPDTAKYPALRLAREVMAARGLSGAVFNAAKERALDGFLARRVTFPQMAEVVERTLDTMSSSGLGNAAMSLDMVLDADIRARATADRVIAAL